MRGRSREVRNADRRTGLPDHSRLPPSARATRGLTPVGHDENGLTTRVPAPRSIRNALAGMLPRANPCALDQAANSYGGKVLSVDDLRHCMECHNTNPHAIETGTGPESADRAIGCERCHGPGGNHLKVVSSHDFSTSRDVDLATMRPSLASGRLPVVDLCAQCHSPRRNSALLDPESPSAVRFQGTTLTRSRCYTESEGKLDCVTCHNPHRNAEASSSWYESDALPAMPCRGCCDREPQRRRCERGRAGPSHVVPSSTSEWLHQNTTCPGYEHDGPHGFYRPLHPRPS